MNPRLFLLLPFFVATALAGEPSAYRKLVVADAVQEDFLGKVKSVKTTTSDVDSEGIATVSSEETSTFDEQGYLLEETSRDLKEKTSSQTRFTYDAAGTLLKKEVTTDGTTVSQSIRFIPEKRRMITEIVTPEGKTLLESEMDYDPFGKQWNGRDFDKKGIVSSVYRVRRDARGKEVEISFSDGLGKVTTSSAVVWDARGFETHEKMDFKAKSASVESDYTYAKTDEAGNWLERDKQETFFEKGRKIGKSREIAVRTITYY